MAHNPGPVRAPRPRQTGNGSRGKIVATYDYTDEEERLLFQCVRYAPKDFSQRRPDGNGGWIWDIQGVRRVLYRMPKLAAAPSERPVYLPEGEKDVHRLEDLGRLATTNPMGAKKWLPEYTEILKGRHVIIIQDNDKKGREHAQKVARSLAGHAASIKVPELPDLPEGKDISDWMDAGHTVGELDHVIAETPQWELPEEGADRAFSADEDEEAWAELGAPEPPSTNGASSTPPPKLEPASPWQPVALEEGHFVRRYTRYAESRTDAPPQYHEILAVAQLSAVVGRGVRIPIAAKPDGMRCNLLVMLLGDSTLYRKSTSEDFAVDLLQAVNAMMFLANDQSPQGFVQEMALHDGGTSLWHRDEFRSFLAQLKTAGWMAGGKELLMKMFDGSSYHRRLRAKTVKGEVVADEEFVDRPYLVAIAAGVTSRIVDVLTVDDVVDGFIPRFLIARPKTRPETRPAGTITNEIEAERRGLIGTLKNLYDGFRDRGDCQVCFDKGVLDHWNGYVAKIETEASASPNADAFGPIAGRMADYALKIATLFQAAEGPPPKGTNLHLTMPMLEAAIELCERLRKDAEDLAMEIGSSAGERTLARFARMVLEHPGIARHEVARALKVDKRELDNLEASALDRELITCKPKNTRGRPAKCYYPGQ